jgi:cytochrome c oxidase subunit I
VASSAGATLLTFGFLLILIYTVLALSYGPVAGDNPWHSRGYEWDTQSPPLKHNFHHVPSRERPPHDYYTDPEDELTPEPREVPHGVR